MTEPRDIGRFHVLREIGRGGMGVVYLARQAELGRDVALKELAAVAMRDPAFAARFLREARIAGSLGHPNVVTVYDYFEHAGVPYIAMEYLPSGSLRAWMDRIDLAQTLSVLCDVLAALELAGARNVVHRDMKPENLLVASDGSVKVADFGISKALDRVGTHFATEAGTAIGTPAYMAPEQATAGDVGPWTDLYALGVIAYELLVGRLPFEAGDTPIAMLYSHVHEAPPPPRSLRPDLDPSLAAWIEALLAKRPEERPTATAALAALDDIGEALLGPRWRRQGRLLELAPRPADDAFETYGRRPIAPPEAGTIQPTPPRPGPPPPASPPPRQPPPPQAPPPPPQAPPPPARTTEPPPVRAATGAGEATIAPRGVPAGAPPSGPPGPGQQPPPGPPPRRRRGLLVGLGAVAVVAAVVVGVVVLTGGGDDEDTAGGTTPATGAQVTTAPQGTTAPPVTTAPTTSTAPVVAPTIRIAAPAEGADAPADLTVRVELTGFVLDAAGVGGEAVAGHGHLHVTMDGGRFDTPRHAPAPAAEPSADGRYTASTSATITYRDLPVGRHQVRVALVGNDDGPVGVDAQVAFVVPLTAAQYVARGAQICRAQERQLQLVASQLSDLPNLQLAQARDVVRILIAVLAPTTTNLTALTPPRALRARHAAIVTAIGPYPTLLRRLERRLSAPGANVRALVTATFAQLDALDAPADRAFRRAGLQACI